MKKNILIKTFTTLGAFASLASIGSLASLTSCNPSSSDAKITITNKIDELYWIAPYQIKVDAQHLDGGQVLFSSSNESVATIDEQGFVHAVANGTTTIKAYSSLDEKVCDEFEMKVNELWVSGTVTELVGDVKRPLEGVNISWEGQTVKTDSTGAYQAVLSNPNAVIYFEKLGYIGAAYGNSYALTSQEHTLDVELVPYDLGESRTITGKIVDCNGDPVPNCSITFNKESIDPFHITTGNDGRYTANVWADPNNPTVSYITHNAKYADQEGVMDIKEKGDQDDIELVPFQYDVKAYVGNDHSNEKIIMHAYNETINDKKGLLVKLESNFVKAFDDGNKFTLTITKSKSISMPNKQAHEAGEFDVSFNPKGFDKDTEKEKTIDWANATINKKDTWHLEIFLPNARTPFFDDSTIGIHLDSNGRGTFTPYEHAKYGTSSANELSYVRLDKNNALFPASDNENYMGLDWDTTTGDNWIVTKSLGNVASKYNFGYQVKIAKNVEHDTGIYVMTKYAQDQMAHFLPDGWQPHFFFYTKQIEGVYPKSNDIGDWIKHIAPISGYWMQSFEVEDVTHPFEQTKEYDQFFDPTFDASAKVYAKDDLMITYIPYSFLKIDQASQKTLGFACNLQYHYTGGEWHAWESDNPTGYLGIPHFEDAASYIQFNLADLEIIPYNEG